MALNPQKALAEALRRAHSVAARTSDIVRARQLSRADRALLVRSNFLVEIVRGWYALTTPKVGLGDTTFWHLHFWGFAAEYLRSRYGDNYSLSAEQSLDLFTENFQTPNQLVVQVNKGAVINLKLPNNTSVLIYPNKGLPRTREVRQGVQVMSLAVALIRSSPTYFTRSATSAELGLRMVRVEELSRALLSGDVNVSAAARMIGGLRHLGLNESAKRLEQDLLAAGVTARPQNPFERPPALSVGELLQSPYAGRIKAMWANMREIVLETYPAVRSGLPDSADYLKRVAEIYTHDAYHSLSIEGYQVSTELIEKIANGRWDPHGDQYDGEQVNAMAAKGYYEAFKTVSASVKAILEREPAGKVAERDLQTWYRALFSPSVTAGILPASALAGYRERPVFIRGSRHVPPAAHAVPYAMDALFEILKAEESAAVRAVLGHFIFVFIHPYSDGNGRMGRFLMNTMLASGGFNWTVIRTDRRREYMAALERASVEADLRPFSEFVVEEMKYSATLTNKDSSVPRKRSSRASLKVAP